MLGLLYKRVVGELGISKITVKAHRAQVMQKMKADSFADLVRMAAELTYHGSQKTNAPSALAHNFPASKLLHLPGIASIVFRIDLFW